MKKERCQNCKFFKGHDECTGCCGKHAPVYVQFYKEPNYGHNRAWPEVRYNEWCGDFRSK